MRSKSSRKRKHRKGRRCPSPPLLTEGQATADDEQAEADQASAGATEADKTPPGDGDFSTAMISRGHEKHCEDVNTSECATKVLEEDVMDKPFQDFDGGESRGAEKNVIDDSDNRSFSASSASLDSALSVAAVSHDSVAAVSHDSIAALSYDSVAAVSHDSVAAVSRDSIAAVTHDSVAAVYHGSVATVFHDSVAAVSHDSDQNNTNFSIEAPSTSTCRKEHSDDIHGKKFIIFNSYNIFYYFIINSRTLCMCHEFYVILIDHCS